MQFCTDGPIRTKLDTRLGGHSALVMAILIVSQGGCSEKAFFNLAIRFKNALKKPFAQSTNS